MPRCSGLSGEAKSTAHLQARGHFTLTLGRFMLIIEDPTVTVK